MNSVANFEIWLNLVKTGQIVDYKKGLIIYKKEKEELKKFKIEIIKLYFDNVDDDYLKKLIEDDHLEIENIVKSKI